MSGLTEAERAWGEFALGLDHPPTWKEAFTAGHQQGRADLAAKVEALADEWKHVGGGDGGGSSFCEGYNAAMTAQAETLRAILAADSTEARP